MKFRRTVTVVMVGAALCGTSCTKARDDFCTQLRDKADLNGLAAAIARRDAPAITTQLRALRSLQDVAPAEVHGDLEDLVDVTTDLVTYISGAKGPEGQTGLVDPTALTKRIDDATGAALRLSAWTKTNCGLDLNSL
jgi:hypothetical protein